MKALLYNSKSTPNRFSIIGSLIALSMFFALQLSAQTIINQDIKVVKEYTPTVSDAVKIEQMPELDDTTSYHPSFKYDILSRLFETSNVIEPITPATMAAEKPSLINNSLAKFGIGTYNTIYGGLNYNILRSNKYALGLYANHESSFGKVTLQDGSKVETPYHDTYAGIELISLFNKITLSSGMKFQHNIYDYYGYQTLNPSSDYLFTNPTASHQGSDLMIDPTQRLTNFDLYLHLLNQQTKTDQVQWTTNFKYSTFGNKTGAKQNKFDISGTLHVPVNDFFLMVDAKVSTFSATLPDTTGPMFYFNNKQSTLISLLPRIGFDFNQGNVEAGLLFAGTVGDDEDGTHIAPHIIGNLTVVEGIASIFGGITGQYNFNDYASTFYENPYASPDLMVENSFYGVDVHGGIKGNFSKTTSFTARFDYNFFNNEHFFVNKSYQRDSIVPTNDYTNLFGVVYDNGSLLKVQGELDLKPSKSVHLRLFACYNGWSLEEEQYAWHKPESELGFTAEVKANRYLTLSSSLTLLGQQYAKNEGGDPIKLKSTVDFNIGANYQMNNKWSFWSKLNNLTSVKYYQWNGYPSYGINLMLGASYSF